jgi:hypothetical protein
MGTEHFSASISCVAGSSRVAGVLALQMREIFFVGYIHLY